ncbi:MAG: hypothetical protein JSR27_05080 [Proteobacteria bacterium]|nr:hypothetical protein [Pseudomonadota bacterium]
MFHAKTFDEAAKESRVAFWTRPGPSQSQLNNPKQQEFGRAKALHIWATCALLRHPRARSFMKTLLVDDVSILNWAFLHTDAMVETAREFDRIQNRKTNGDARDRTRTFTQKRDAVVKALRNARQLIPEVSPHDFPLHVLLDGDQTKNFRDTLLQFQIDAWKRRRNKFMEASGREFTDDAPPEQQMLAVMNPLIESNGDVVPDLCSLLRSAEERVAKLKAPKAARYGADRVYLRHLFRRLGNWPVAIHRIAFLSHAGEAVFGKCIEKKDVRNFVADLALLEDRERKYGKWITFHD